MKIIQLLPTLAYGDAVGNDALALHGCLSQKGYTTLIYAENIDPRVNKEFVKHYTELPALSEDDILLYHFSTGCEALAQVLRKCICRKVMIYHNITPREYFSEYNTDLAKLVDEGRKELRSLKDVFECCLADSEYNKQDLIREGYTCPIGVLPILIPFKDYEKLPDKGILEKYENDGITNILFTGRIAPNKKQEDVIAAFAYYHKFMNPKSRLFIVGSESGMEIYADRLRQYVKLLGVQENVVFTGHIPFSQILAYYSLADVFLCMSGHEGFCVPLIEAMIFNIPVLAYRAAAVPETLGHAGIILDDRKPVYVAEMIQNVVGNKPLYKALAVLMQKRLDDFSYEKTTEKFEEYLNAITEKRSVVKIVPVSNTETTEYKLLQKTIAEWKDNDHQKKRRKVHLPDFDQVPVVPREVAVANSGQTNAGLKKRVKKVLKTAYLGIASVSPALANTIREQMYGTWHLIKGEKSKDEGNQSSLLRENSGLLIDVTQTTKHDAGTGIQRVVNNIFREIYKHKEERNVIAVRTHFNRLITSFEYVSRIEPLKEIKEYEVPFLRKDKILLLDSSWEYSEDFSQFLEIANKKGAKAYAVVYDMFPVQYPELFDTPAFVAIFCMWHNMILQKADSILCISRTTADVVAKYFQEKKFKRNRPLNLYYFHMGADVPGGTQEARDKIQNFVNHGKTFLMVGTLEPRKGHMIALQAFSKILKEGRQDCRLLIIGHNGWKNDEILNQIALPAYKDKVLWIQDAADEELRWAYAHSNALIAASRDEGFGLPLVEAAHFGLPIICSDIPIFREVTQGNADYFKAMDADDLARCISKWMETENHPDSGKIHIYTWQEAAQEILDIMDGNEDPYKVL
ncbi:MAG: glycosyltransferase [Acidaminococcaceae bacterium]|nr:glycosyltransferase [Acidaminococcaceae bacterium]